MKKVIALTVIFALSASALADMKTIKPGDPFIAGFDRPRDHSYYNFRPLGCSSNNDQGSYSCIFDFSIRSSKQDNPVIYRQNFIATYPDGSYKWAEKFGVDDKDYTDDVRFTFFPGDTHRLKITFPLPNQAFNKLKYLDFGYQNDSDWVRTPFRGLLKRGGTAPGRINSGTICADIVPTTV